MVAMKDTASGDDVSEISRSQRSIIVKFLTFLSSVFFSFTAYYTLLFLQSSINIEGGVGLAASTTTYVTSVVFCLFVTPLLLRKFGVKFAVAICQLAYLIYIVLNFYPKPYTLIPGGAIVGLAEATIWISYALYSVHYARSYARCRTGKLDDVHVPEFMGYLFAAYQMSLVFGNLVSYAIFHSEQHVDNNHTSSLLTGNLSGKEGAHNLQVCGVNDCQDPNVTAQSLEQYVPASETTLYVMVGCLAGFELLAFVIHVKFVENIGANDERTDTDDTASKSPTVEDNEAKDNEAQIQLIFTSGSNPNQMEATQEIQTRISDNVVDKDPNDACDFVLTTIKAIFRQMVRPRQMLLAPLAMYAGLFPSFVFSELTRAFASCMLGVGQVSLCMVVYAVADSFSSFTTGKVTKKFGRNPAMIFGCLLDVGCYLTYLLWQPNEKTVGLVYLLFIMAGLSDAIWKTTSAEVHASYFPDQQAIAFNVWSIWYIFSFALQFGYSTRLCMREKIYIQLAVLGLSMTCYGGNELLSLRSRTPQSLNAKNELGTKCAVKLKEDDTQSQ